MSRSLVVCCSGWSGRRPPGPPAVTLRETVTLCQIGTACLLSHCVTEPRFHGTLTVMPVPSDLVSPTAGTSLGLRERNKLRTRQEIADATIRLAAERGLDHVTVEQIAAAADVAPAPSSATSTPRKM